MSRPSGVAQLGVLLLLILAVVVLVLAILQGHLIGPLGGCPKPGQVCGR